MKKLHAIFGGNFDPIHYGHICLAEQLAKEISIEKIIFLPNNNPPHRKKTKTSIINKLEMIRLAIDNNSLFNISDLEIKQKKIFYTVETLKKIRKKIGYLRPLCFIIGEDNLQNFNSWKNWKKILSYSHLVICPRIHTEKKNNYELNNWINAHRINNHNLMHHKSFGLIFFSNTPIINISSSKIRHNYSTNKNSYGLLPSIVDEYIILKKLYCDD